MSIHKVTFDVVAEKFLEYQKGRLRPLSYRVVSRHVRLAKPLHKLPAGEIDRRAITALMCEIQTTNGDITANRVRTTLSHLFRWSINEGLLNQNPLLGINKLKETPRDRVLENSEIRAIWQNAGENRFGMILKFMLITGQTIKQTESLRWSELRSDRFIVPAIRTKTGSEHVVPLSAPAVEVLRQAREANTNSSRSDLIFAGGHRLKARSKAQLDYLIAKKIGRRLPQWSVRDLRRTATDGMAKLGILPNVIAGAISSQNEVDGATVGEPEMRDALDRWAIHVMSIVQGEEP